MRNWRPNGLVLDKWRLIYWFIPKNASSSLKAMFGRHYGYRLDKPMGSPHLFWSNRSCTIHPNEARHYHKFTSFTVVRNPYSRLYSVWKEKIFADGRKGPNLRKGVNYKVFGNMPAVRCDMTFAEFVRLVVRMPYHTQDRHFALQSLHVQFGGEWITGNVFKFEEMETTLRPFLEGHGVPWDLPRVNISQHHHPDKEPDFRKVYDAETAAPVAEYYRDDFKNFGYDKNSFD